MKKMIMKRNLLVLLLALMTSVPMLADVAINATNFPDENFRNYLLYNNDLRIDTLMRGVWYPKYPTDYRKTYGIGGYGKDKKLTTAEINRIYFIRLDNVKNLKGIEYFTELRGLICTGITTETVNLSNNSKLTLLHLQGNFKSVNFPTTITNLKLDAPLTSLDLTGLTKLSGLRLDNTNLTSIDLSSITNPTMMSCIQVGIYNPQKPITIVPPLQVTFGSNVGPFRLNMCICNSKNTELDFSAFVAYSNGFCLTLIDNSNLTTLKLPTEKTVVGELIIHNSPNLTSLNVDGCTELWSLSYRGNGFKSVNVSENTVLRLLECDGNGLTSLDVSNNTALTHLYCQDNLLTSLDLSNNTDLRALECNNNKLTELNLSKNTLLRTVGSDTTGTAFSPVSPKDRYYTAANEQWSDSSVSPFYFFGTDLCESWIFDPSISLSPQILSKDYVAIDGRGKLGVQCNTNDGVLTSYGNYTALADEGNNYIMVADETVDGKTDVHAYRDTVRYSYNTGFTGDYVEAKTMAVKIGTSAHGMYVHPETRTTEYTNSYNGFYWGTLYLEFPARIPEGVQCYYPRTLRANEDLADLVEVTGTIPANTAVIVKAPTEPKFFAFNESDETPAAPSDNIIEGTIEGLSVAPGTVLTLGHNVDRSTGEYDNFGFWDYRGNRISPFRAYIPKYSLSSGAKNGFSLVFPEDNITGIARLTNDNTAEEGVWYTLSGTRINGKPTTKGIYVNNGQKIVIR